jgi:misacylated tRNA(Ala) deacylase
MRTEELAIRDAYQRTVEATVVDILPEGLVLDRTVFYARGGGQPGDCGTIRWDGGRVPVVDTIRRSGVPLHVPDGEAPAAGTVVEAEIDWDRRYRLMRTHTALHVLSAVIFDEFDAKVTGGNMEPGSARMDFELDAISVDFGRRVEGILNDVLAAGHAVTVEFLPRETALADPDLIRTKVSLIPESVDPIRVVTIGAIDRQADGGTHVADTREVGSVRVAKTESKGRGNKRIRIELEE